MHTEHTFVAQTRHMNNESVKKSILKLREEKGFTQEEMAALMGVSRTSYQKIESGSTKLISDNVFKFSDATGESAERIVLGYVPVSSETAYLRDVREAAESRYNRMKEGYDRRIDALVTENTNLKAAHKEDQRMIKELTALLSRLEKKLDTAKND